MNGVAQLGLPITIEVNYDPGKPVGLEVLDDSGSSPVLVGSLIPMLNVVDPVIGAVDTLYRAQFTPVATKSYIFRKAVYLDDTYTALDPNYSRSSESIQVIDFSTFLSPRLVPIVSVSASIKAVPSVAAFINSPAPLVGTS